MKRRPYPARVAAAEAALSSAGLMEAWKLFVSTDAPDKYEERTIRDIVAKLVKYGSVSDKAMNYVSVLLKKIVDRPALEAARAAEDAAAAPVPVSSGRTKVEGEVLTVKVKETQYGPVTKMLVKAPAGYKLWGTVPSAIYGVERGDKIELEASVAISERDPKFGFYSRPSKARVTMVAAREAARLAAGPGGDRLYGANT